MKERPQPSTQEKRIDISIDKERATGHWGEWHTEPSTQERSFTLQDMLECWDASSKWAFDFNHSVEWASKVEEPDRGQYFKEKFNIHLSQPIETKAGANQGE